MATTDIGVAVIGAGMAGKAHAAAYRTAPTLYENTLPPIRLVSVADASQPLAAETAARYGYSRHDTSWQAIAEAPDIDAVSVVVGNALHREIVEGLLAAGKHVLCEKPLADTIDNARAMADAAHAASGLARVGFTYRRAPGIAFLGELIRSGELGAVYHIGARYHTDYATDPHAAMSWRFRGAPGTGALADVGSHVSYIAEFLGGEIAEVAGGRFSTVIPRRPKPLGVVAGHGNTAVGDEWEDVTNDDYATFSIGFANGAAGSVEVSRVAAGHPNGLVVEVFAERGSATWQQERPSEVGLYLAAGPDAQRGTRRVLLDSHHPYVRGSAPIDVGGVGFGQNEGFQVQARAFLEEIAGIPAEDALPRNATFDDGVRNHVLLEAVTASAREGGRTIPIGA